MVEGRSIAAWWHTAALLAILANPNRDRKKHPQPYTAAELHPHFANQRKREGLPVTRDSIGMLKMFLPTQKHKKKR